MVLYSATFVVSSPFRLEVLLCSPSLTVAVGHARRWFPAAISTATELQDDQLQALSLVQSDANGGLATRFLGVCFSVCFVSLLAVRLLWPLLLPTRRLLEDTVLRDEWNFFPRFFVFFTAIVFQTRLTNNYYQDWRIFVDRISSFLFAENDQRGITFLYTADANKNIKGM